MLDAHTALRLQILRGPVLPTIQESAPDRHLSIAVGLFESASVDEVADIPSAERAAVSRREQREIRGMTREFTGPRAVAASTVTMALCTIAGKLGSPRLHGGVGRLEMSLESEARSRSDSKNDDQFKGPRVPAFSVHHGFVAPDGFSPIRIDDQPRALGELSPERREIGRSCGDAVIVVPSRAQGQEHSSRPVDERARPSTGGHWRSSVTASHHV